MASAVFASRNEPRFGTTKALMKNYPPNRTHNFSNFASRFNVNPSFNASSPHPENSRVMLNNDEKQKQKSHIASRTVIYNVHDDDDLYATKFVSFDLASLSSYKLKELKNRLIMELRCVRGIIQKIEAHEIESMPKTMRIGSGGGGEGKRNRVSGQKRRRALDSPLSKAMRKCREALVKLMNLKSAVSFNQPVDVEVLQLPDYNLIIKHPMDLGTIKSKLEKSRYRTPKAFASDVRLTFENAMVYNLKGSKVYVSAEKLLSRFEQLFDPISKNYEAQCPDGKQSAKSKAKYDYVKELVEVKSVVPMLENVVSKSREMSIEEKEELVEQLQEMPPEVAVNMMYFLKGQNPGLMVEGDEIELDIEALDAGTLWELQRFVASYKNGSKVENPGLVSDLKKNPEHDSHVIELEPDNVETDKEKGEVEEDVDIGEEILVDNFPSVEIETDVAHPRHSGSSSGSSSSDSDSQSPTDSDSSSLSSSEEDGAGTPFVEEGNKAQGMDEYSIGLEERCF